MEISPEARTSLSDLQAGLQAQGVRAGNWTDPALFHITVLFLGQQPDAVWPLLTSAAARAAADVPAFTLTLAGLGAFDRNRILWMGLSDDGAVAQLARLYRALCEVLRSIPSVRLEDRPYRPHLTLARKLDVDSFRARDAAAGGQGQGQGGSNGEGTAGAARSRGLRPPEGAQGTHDLPVGGRDPKKVRAVEDLGRAQAFTVNALSLFESTRIAGKLAYPVVHQSLLGPGG